MRLFFLLVVAVALSACVPASSSAGAGSSASTTIPKDEQSCRIAGGTWRPVCLMGKPACVVAYADAGKTCRDGNECQGKQCRYAGKTTSKMDGREATGECVATSDPCGCFTLVQEGKIQGTLCVD